MRFSENRENKLLIAQGVKNFIALDSSLNFQGQIYHS